MNSKLQVYSLSKDPKFKTMTVNHVIEKKATKKQENTNSNYSWKLTSVRLLQIC